jgi:hypothetical protein
VPGITFYARETWSDNVPGVFASVTELATGNTCGKTVVANTDGFVLESIGKVVFAFGHGTDEDADALRGAQRVDVISDSYDICVKTQGDLPAIGWQVVRDRVLDDFEELLL